MQRATSILLAGPAAALLVGCGSGGYGPANLETAPAPASHPAVSPPSGGRPELVVGMRGLAFTPRTVTATVGRGIEWINRDEVRHNVTSLDGATIASPDLPPGGRFVYVPVRPGPLRYLCTIHPSTMSGLVVVRRG